MTETNEPEEKKPLTLSGRGKLEMKKPAAAGQVRQNFSHGRSKTVTVEVKKKRSVGRGREATPKISTGDVRPTLKAKPASEAAPAAAPAPAPEDTSADKSTSKTRVVLKALTDDEKVARVKALENSIKDTQEARARAEVESERRQAEETRLAVEHEAAEAREAEEQQRKKNEEDAKRKAAEQAAQALGEEEESSGAAEAKKPGDAAAARRRGQAEPRRAPPRRGGERRRGGKLTVSQALNDRERVRSLASMRRQREREKRQAGGITGAPEKVLRDVVIPESITVQELANRMAERSVDVIKSLMQMDIMATLAQKIDGDTAQLVAEEFNHRVNRVSAADVEVGFLEDGESEDANLEPRSPIVTVMGHVDHGKTSLLDALRNSEVAEGEAGGITQHIGAYQVVMEKGTKITFLDTPGHEAFTAMRARGATVTDIVVLVVAADDGIMPQTIEAIHHARAAEVPIVVAINKIDRPDADANKVRQELLQHEVVVEEMGGEVLAVEVSAKDKTGLDKLEEAIMLQFEVMELKASPVGRATGVVVEAKLEQGRGNVATVLVRRGTLNVGDIVVAGSEWGRVRALVNDRGDQIETAGPAEPVEILGIGGAPEPGDDFGIVDSEARAREIVEFRIDKSRDDATELDGRSTVEQMFDKIGDTQLSELPLVIKADVRGSLEAIIGALKNISTDEVAVQILHGAVGGITESDVTLANASRAMIIGFGVRANAQARQHAKRDHVEIRYYKVIYDVVDQIKGMLSGMLSPQIKETTLGQARVKEVFGINKLGKIAGCEVSDGVVRRGANVRLLRDDIVVHEGSISALRHFKDDVREVRAGSDCGIRLDSFEDVKQGDIIEAFEVEEIDRTL